MFIEILFKMLIFKGGVLELLSDNITRTLRSI